MKKDYVKVALLEEDTMESTCTMSKESILHWLLEAEASEVRWIFSEVSNKRKDLIVDAQKELARKSMKTMRASMRNSRRSLLRDEIHWQSSLSIDKDAPPILQFSSPVYFVEETDEQIIIDVIRIGDTSRTSVVNFQTKDDSAFDGISYVGNSGRLVFDPGITRQTITVDVLPSSMWNTTTEFQVLLTADGLSGAVLGQYLFIARVRLIDVDAFPNSKFESVEWENEEGLSEEGFSAARLLVEYCKMNWNISKVRSATIKWMLVDCFHTLTHSLELFMNVYLLDFILNTKRPSTELWLLQSRDYSLLLLALVRLIIFLLGYWLDYSRLSFGLLGTSMSYIKVGLVRKFLNYNKHVREELDPGRVLMAIQRDVDKIVLDGYLNFIELARHAGSIATMFLFMLVSPLITGSQANLEATSGLLFMPLILNIFLYIRTETIHKHVDDVNQNANALASDVALTTNNCELILDYSLRNKINHHFDLLVKKCNVAVKACKQLNLNNDYFAHWVTFLSIAAYTYFGGMRVIGGQLNVGIFVTNLTIIGKVGQACVQVYEILVAMQESFPSMLSVATLLNKPTDVMQRKSLQENKLSTSAALCEEYESDNPDKSIAVVDKLPIMLDLGNFTYNTSIAHSLTFRGRVTVEQGQFIAVVGDKASGKATMLRLISNTLLPEPGNNIFVPAHLRCVNVADDSLFITGTLLDNLRFGIDLEHPDAKPERIKQICKDILRMDKRVLAYLEEDHEHKWSEMFSAAQCRLLMIARALVFNAELITIHRLLAVLGPTEITHVLDALCKHVAQKGLLQQSNVQMRRPRTLFLSTRNEDSISQKAHQVILVTQNGIRTKRQTRL